MTSKMTENYFMWIREYRALYTDIFFPFDINVLNNFPSKQFEIVKLHDRLDQLKPKIKNLPKAIIQECKSNLIDCTKKLIQLLTSKLNLPLSRDQGTTIQNFIFGKVLSTLDSAMDNGNTYSYSIFYFESNGNFNSKELMTLLNKLIDELEKLDFSTFEELQNFYEEYKKQIHKMWTNENLISNNK